MRRRPNGAQVRIIVMAAIGLTLATMLLGCSRDGTGDESLPTVTPQPTPTASPTALADSLKTATPAPATPRGPIGTPAVAVQSTASPTASPRCPSEGTPSDRAPDGPSAVFLRDTAVDLGTSATIPVTLSSAPNGLSGYMIEVSVADIDVATLVDVTFPEFGLVRRVPSASPELQLAAADLTRLVEPGAVDATLVTVVVVGARLGTTELRIEVDMMSDDNGNPMTPEARGATLTVC